MAMRPSRRPRPQPANCFADLDLDLDLTTITAPSAPRPTPTTRLRRPQTDPVIGSLARKRRQDEEQGAPRHLDSKPVSA